MSRRIFAEDFNWSPPVPMLSKTCLQWIIDNFEVVAHKQIFEKVPPTQQDFIEERLSLSLSLHVTSKLVPDGVYWKRCCEQRWDFCDVTCYDFSWKQMFFQRHFESLIELFIPNVTNPKTVLDVIPLCNNYVKKLKISQLLPPVKEQEEEDEYGRMVEEDESSMARFNFGLVLDKLTNLEELQVAYRVKQCGLNFDRKMLKMTELDCISLANAFITSKTLKVLRLPGSCIDDDKCRLLVNELLDSPNLRELDLAHNMIGYSGARAIGKLLLKSQLEVLKMYNNGIKNMGAKAIAHALSKNPTLLSLSLRLNQVGDEGSQAICKALQGNTILLHLHLASNDLTPATVPALSEMLMENKTLRSLNLSGNRFDEAAGAALGQAKANNTTLQQLELECQRD